MSEEEIKVLIVEALDHFRTTNINTKTCTLRYVGEYAGEDENYIFMRYKNIYFDDREETEKIFKVIKKAILSIREFIELKERSEAHKDKTKKG